MRRYIIIVSVGDKKVISIVESPIVNSNNVWDVSASLGKYWLGRSAEFPPPTYDIILGTWDSISAVQGTVGHSWNWESASCESLPAVT